MSAQTSKGKNKLEFNKIRSNRHTVYGVLTDKKGNTFSVEVTGTNKTALKKFIKYQIEKSNQGKGITTSVRKLSAKEQKSLTSAKKGREKEMLDENKTRRQPSWEGISMKVKLLELYKKTNKPQKIRLVIDPPIATDKVMDFPIDQQFDANIRCSISAGQVNLELYEFTDLNKTTSILRDTKTASAGQPAQFNVHQTKQTSPADWNFRVTGITPATFTLTLDLFVL